MREAAGDVEGVTRPPELVHPACGDRVTAEPMALARHILACHLATDDEREVAQQALAESRALDPAYARDKRAPRPTVLRGARRPSV